ncbi:hypothetical protein P885DRAFT_71172 [Corynascus similis CBS 632.67]
MQLPEGYEIRRLEREHLPWVQAIVGHTMSFDSPIWSKVFYEAGPTQRAYDMYHAIAASALQSIDFGLSYGVFLTNHSCRIPGEKGRLEWNFGDATATREQLLGQMDFPLVSIALSKDAAAPKPPTAAGVRSWGDIVDGHNDISAGLKAGDARDQQIWVPEREGEVVRRSGTHTRGDHAGRGLARALAHRVMREVRDDERRKFRAILIHTGAEAVNRLWLHPPAPFHAELVSNFDTACFSKARDETGEVVYNPFGTAKVECKRIWITWPAKENF